ncbi:primary amine oxidase, liver isozyme-like [Myxocyprinus asiaticus]|uniref:primary amine oxidase, liver isozyme-like n=1 Tax=Myxocyprinus asiaticus TaxID=70543 RepID=UPI0022222360|nr:primary amine oxidase, liver isozyme-like [Myxocyprinus asiaticus]
MNSLLKYSLILLGFISVIINIVLLCLNTNRRPKCMSQPQEILKVRHSDKSLIYADLTAEEYKSVRDYMWAQKDLQISQSATARPSENFIFLIDLSLPKKADALRYLDANGQKPPRDATVVVFHGARGYLKEYVVGHLPGPLRHRDVTQEKYNTPTLPFTARMVTIGEYVQLFTLLNKVFQKLEKPLKESFGYVPRKRELLLFEGMPRGLKAGDRKTWISFFRDYSGMYIHPVGFEILICHESRNSSEWTVERLLYNGQYFNSTDEFKKSYEKGSVKKIAYREIPNYASLKPMNKPSGLGPHQYYLKGKRFSVQNNQVVYLDWSFAFGLSSLTGMRVFDIRFKGERIVYELSVQEAMSVYGSITPGMMLTKFLDSSIGIGRFAHELVRGIDCPYTATYVDTYRYVDTNVTLRSRNSICVFEHDAGRPLRRHFSDFFHNGYGGMANSALVFRTITAIGNYDYIWDFIFYQSGSVEARVHATGYISSSFMIDGSLQYGHQVAENVLGNIHTHFINFKVDLDILGVKNVFQTKDMVYKEVSLPWMPSQKAKIPQLVEQQIRTEKEAAMQHNTKTPRYLHIASNRTNRWGHQRSYRLQVLSFAGDHLPESEPEEKSMSWARYKVAITKHKDTEQTSSSLYSQNYMQSPFIDFSKFIDDNEVIDNEDLVAWVTTGFLHIPHAEDIPNTVTVGNGGGVIIRPHNYFDEDPSIHSPDGVYFSPGSENDCEYNKMACLEKDMCSSSLEPFTYHGFEGVMKFD